MSTLKNILVPTDFSEEANNALDVAVEIARVTNAKITLLHIVDVPSIGHDDHIKILGASEFSEAEPGLYRSYVTKLLKVTKARLEALIQSYPHVDLQEHVVFDSLQKHLADFVVKDQTDLIVIGSKGASGMDEVLIGSNTEKVIRLSKVPVLTVKGKHPDFSFRNIVFASNFKHVNERVAHWLKELQSLFGSTIHFVKIITPNTFEITPKTIGQIQEFAERYQFEDYTVNFFNHLTEEEGIREFGDQIGASVLALVTHGRTGLSHLMLGSIAEEVANHAVMPVLTFNQHFQ